MKNKMATRECARMLIALIILILTGCKTIEQQPVSTTKVDTVYLSQLKKYKEYARDSIYIIYKGDTVFKTQYKYKVKYIETHDTVYKNRIDTILVTHIVEAQPNKLQRIKMHLDEMLIIFLCVAGAIIMAKLFKRP